LIAIALVMAPACGARADVYRWVDQDGGVHYGDTRPHNAESETVPLDGAGAATRQETIEAQRRRLDEAVKEAERRREARQATAAARRSEEAAHRARQQQCQAARVQLAVLQERQLPAYRTEDGELRARWKYDSYGGERAYLDEESRETELRRVRAEIEEFCKNPDDTSEQERVRTRWIMAELCAAARAELAVLEQSRARTAAQKLEKKRRAVARLCKDQPDSTGYDSLPK
jgi:hypothetical protein